MRILIVTSVEAEYTAIVKGLSHTNNITVMIGGVGPIESSIQTTIALSKETFDLVISSGIGGGFKNRTNLGSLVLANQILSGDLGAETAKEFLPLDELGFGSSHIDVNKSLLIRITKILETHLSIAVGPIITVSTATGTEKTMQTLQKRIPNVLCEAMEGFGVASAAKAYNIPSIEIRAISNFVGIRDKFHWKIEEALSTLSKAFRIIGEELVDENRFFTVPK